MLFPHIRDIDRSHLSRLKVVALFGLHGTEALRGVAVVSLPIMPLQVTRAIWPVKTILEYVTLGHFRMILIFQVTVVF